MGKIVKYCSSCEEGFAEKFSFCPNCGKQMQAFEMIPQIGETYIPQRNTVSEEDKPSVREAKTENLEAVKNEIVEMPPVIVPPVAEESFYTEPISEATEKFSELEPQSETVEEAREEIKEEKTKTLAASAAASTANFGRISEVSNENYSGYQKSAPQSDGFYVTVIEEKNAGQRNALLLGTFAFMSILILTGVVYSIFNKQLGVAAIEQGNLIALVPEIEPVPVEPEVKPKKEKDDGGGGGGGGKEEPDPVSKGRLATQEAKPMIAPSSRMTQVTNPTIPIQASTEGKNKRPITDEPYGLPNGLQGLSDGRGRGGGMGSGDGRGMGSGRGTGEGSGLGSGSGGGNGSGNGNGNGPGGGAPPPPPPAKPKVPEVTQDMRIISRPRPNYTDAARQNNVQGTVTLKVTFLASGQIGSISPVSGLPYGLTEQAIAAARAIRFEPKLVNGQPQSVTKTVQFSFTIY